LHEYSNRQWSGLLSDFYKPRWIQFIDSVTKNWGHFDQKKFDDNIKQWEWNWVQSHKDFPTEAQGNATQVVEELYKKYRAQIIPLTKIQPKIDYNY